MCPKGIRWVGNIRALLTCGLLVALLAACAVPRQPFVAARDGNIGAREESGMLVLSAAADGRVAVVIRGDPFAGEVVNPSAVVAAALRLPPGFSRVTFDGTTQAEEGRGERLVLVFDSEELDPGVHRMCRNLDSVEVGPPVGPVRVAAAFCIGKGVARGAVGSTTRPSSMDMEFKRFLDRVLMEVFPFHTRVWP